MMWKCLKDISIKGFSVMNNMFSFIFFNCFSTYTSSPCCFGFCIHVSPVLCFPLAVLHGLDLESEHCIFENHNGQVTLVPLGGAQCSVNGVQVMEPSQLNQGETTDTSSVSWRHIFKAASLWKYVESSKVKAEFVLHCFQFLCFVVLQVL